LGDSAGNNINGDSPRRDIIENLGPACSDQQPGGLPGCDKRRQLTTCPEIIGNKQRPGPGRQRCRQRLACLLHAGKSRSVYPEVAGYLADPRR
jgi:hypothetical protein